MQIYRVLFEKKYSLRMLQVAPAELESLLLGHHQVADCAVVGVPDLEAGELPRAYVVLKAGQSTTEKQLQQYIAGECSTVLFYKIYIFKEPS